MEAPQLLYIWCKPKELQKSVTKDNSSIGGSRRLFVSWDEPVSMESEREEILVAL